MNISVVKTVIVDFLCSVIFFSVREKLFTLLPFHIAKNGTKDMVQALEQKGQSCGGLECGAALCRTFLHEKTSVTHAPFLLLKVWTECNQQSCAGL